MDSPCALQWLVTAGTAGLLTCWMRRKLAVVVASHVAGLGLILLLSLVWGEAREYSVSGIRLKGSLAHGAFLSHLVPLGLSALVACSVLGPWSKRRCFVLAAGLGAIVGLYLASKEWPVRESTMYACVECGLNHHEIRVYGKDRSEDRRTRLADWRDRRVPGRCEHQWAPIGCRTQYNIWGDPGRACLLVGTRYIDGNRLGDFLVRLEPLGLDLAFQEARTKVDSGRMRAADDAESHVESTWSDERLLRWWTKTQRFLDTPAAWSAGFASFR